MKQKLLAALAAVLVITGCQTTEQTLGKLLPAEPLAVVYLDKPGEVIKETWATLDSLGLLTALGAESFEDQMAKLKEESEGRFDPAWIDLSRPAVLGFQSPEEVFLAVPVTAGKEAQDGLKAYLEEDLNLEVKLEQGWALGTQGESDASLGFDLENLSRTTAQGVRYFVDLKKAKTLAGLEGGAWAENLAELMEDLGDSEAQAGSLKTLLTLAVKAVDQAGSLSGSFSLSRQGLGVSTNLGFVPGSEVESFFAKQPPVKGSREFLKYLPKDYLLGFVSNMDYGVWKEELKDLNGTLMQGALTDETLRKTILDFQNQIMEVTGQRSSFAVDLDFDVAKLEAGNLNDGLGLFAVVVVESPNPQSYRKLTLNYLQSPSLKNYIADALKTLPLTLDFVVTPEQTKGGVTWDEIKFQLGSSMGMEDMTTAALTQMDLTLYMATGKDKVYFTFGKDGRTALQKMVAKDAYDGKTWAAGLETNMDAYPDNSHFAGNLNITRLLQLVKKVPQASMVPAGLPDSPGMTGWLQLEKGTFRTAYHWNYAEMEAVIKPFAAFLPLFLGNSGLE